MEIAEHIGERKRVLGAEREEQRVLGGGGLQLEVELAAESLTEREAPCLVDAASERRVQDELHAARFVEESLQDDRVLRRQHAKRGEAVREVCDGLVRGGERNPCFLSEPRNGRPKGLHYIR